MRTQLLAAIGAVLVVTAASATAQQGPTPGQIYREANRGDLERQDSEAFKFQWLTAQQLAQRAADYRKMTEPHRLNAIEIAERARNGTLPPGVGPRIREALESDFNAWHEALQVRNRDWNAMRKQWLLPVNSLTDQQWAVQRANWFAARDAWITNRIRLSEGNRPSL